MKKQPGLNAGCTEDRPISKVENRKNLTQISEPPKTAQVVDATTMTKKLL